MSSTCSPALACSDLLLREGKATLGQVRSRRAWDLALSPAKSIPMQVRRSDSRWSTLLFADTLAQAFVMYMTGGGVQIFSMMSVGMLMKSSLGSMLGVNRGALALCLLTLWAVSYAPSLRALCHGATTERFNVDERNAGRHDASPKGRLRPLSSSVTRCRALQMPFDGSATDGFFRLARFPTTASGASAPFVCPMTLNSRTGPRMVRITSYMTHPLCCLHTVQ